MNPPEDPLERKLPAVLRRRPYAYDDTLAQYQSSEEHWQERMNLSDQDLAELYALEGRDLQQASTLPEDFFADEPRPNTATAVRRPSRSSFAWGSAVAAVLVAGVGIGLYQRTVEEPPTIQAVNPAAVEIYGANLATALEAVAALPPSGKAELELLIRLKPDGPRLQGPAKVLSASDGAIRRASLQAVQDLQAAGLVPWQGAENLLVRYRLTFDGKLQKVTVFGPSVRSPSATTPDNPG
ncbi:MAG: hypothetical protein KME03_17890 [Aphanocapsa lilacina HA4352-LM1]|jgi:hypothetical protein|nr:hypothetical protein [Aphanocapsa lilacina HA4352-LM1]